MAPPKRSTAIEDPPSASSSEDEEEASNGEEEEEEDGEEGDSSEEEEEEEEKGRPTTAQEEKTQKPLSSPTQPAKPASKNQDSNAAQREEEEESESDTDSDADQPDPKVIKPISSKPMEEAATPTKSSKPRSKSSTAAATPKPAASAKRGLETDSDENIAKRAKKKKKKKDLEEDGVTSAGVEKSDGKKLLFQRLWSEEDEIVVLKGVIDFMGKKGVDPAKDMVAFYDFIKNSLHIDVTHAQLKDKVWRLKRKFENHVKKGKQGEEKTFTKDHDQKAFDLSKKIWGSEGTVNKGGVVGGESGIKSNGKVAKKGGNEKANVKTLAELEEHFDLAPSKGNKRENLGFQEEKMMGLGKLEVIGGMEEYVLRKGMEMMDGAKRVEMEQRLRKLHVEEIKLFLKRNELVRENAQLLLAAYSETHED